MTVLARISSNLPVVVVVVVCLSSTIANWIKETIRGITRRKALETWEKKIRNCKVTPQAILPIVKSLLKRVVPKAPTAIHFPSSLKYQLWIVMKINSHENHKWLVEARVQVILEAVDDTPLEKVRQKYTEINKVTEIEKGLWN
jgi:DNA-binding Lrp family transcriptional regulator